MDNNINNLETHEETNMNVTINSQIKCLKCGEVLKEDNDFCPKCGTAVTKQKAFCAKCGAELADDQDFCINVVIK